MLKVFISYASEDRSLVVPYFNKLKMLGFSPWMDQASIMPGDLWLQQIEQAFLASDVYLIFMSPRSVNKRGFVQREAREAIDKLQYARQDDITVIPVRLEPCEVPRIIAEKVQYIDLEGNGWDRVISSLQKAAAQRDLALNKGVQHGVFTIYEEAIIEDWSGKPGYSASVSYPRFECPTKPTVVRDLNAFFAGRSAQTLFDLRSVKLNQFDEEEYWTSRQNEFQEGYDIAFVGDELVSIVTQSWGYYVGAAHGNMGYQSDTFIVDDNVVRLSLEDFFQEGEAALTLISDTCVEKLKKEHWERTGVTANDDDVKDFQQGAGPNWANFKDAFTVNAQGFVFRFPPYQVACYAMGPWSVDVSFYELRDVLGSASYVKALLKR